MNITQSQVVLCLGILRKVYIQIRQRKDHGFLVLF